MKKRIPTKNCKIKLYNKMIMAANTLTSHSNIKINQVIKIKINKVQ